jgi:hypothetical protein
MPNNFLQGQKRANKAWCVLKSHRLLTGDTTTPWLFSARMGFCPPAPEPRSAAQSVGHVPCKTEHLKILSLRDIIAA